MTSGFQLLGKYALQECLQQGGVADVWKAIDQFTRSTVVIKIPHADLRRNPDFMTYFWGLPRQREAQAILSLQHRNIARIQGFSVSLPTETGNTVPYMVTDYIAGQSLWSYMQKTSHLGVYPADADLAHFFATLASAVGYAHQQGVFHGNIKPDRIMLEQDQTMRNPILTPILTDCGIVPLLQISTSALCHWEPETRFYISPEQAKGQPASRHGDIYALGVILYEMCTGKRPFSGEQPPNVFMQPINPKPPAPSEINPEISPAVSAVIMRSLAHDPEERFPTATAMARALAEALDVARQETLRQPVVHPDMLNGRTDESSIPTSLPKVAISFGTAAPRAEMNQLYPRVTTPLPESEQSASPSEPAPERKSRGGRIKRVLLVFMIILLVVLTALILAALLLQSHSLHL